MAGPAHIAQVPIVRTLHGLLEIAADARDRGDHDAADEAEAQALLALQMNLRPVALKAAA